LIAETYAKIVETDADILSVHMSSGLSNTINAAKLAANLVPQAQITHYDTKTLSVTSGWQVIAAAQAIKLGWQKEKIIELMQRISNAANSIFTLNELRYLRHGGRISHMKGLLASLLNIKPLIGVEKVNGTYTQLGQSRSFGSAIEKISSLITRHIPAGATIRAQIVHGQNHDGAEMLKKSIEQKYKCKWLPTCAISLVLGSHTGPSVVGIAFAPEAAIADAL
jgi:DegV family protein with EDD domain